MNCWYISRGHFLAIRSFILYWIKVETLLHAVWDQIIVATCTSNSILITRLYEAVYIRSEIQ